jgi:hypothetical protein
MRTIVYPLNDNTPIPAVDRYTGEVLDLAERNVAAIATVMPSGEADIQTLKDRRADLAIKDLAWFNAVLQRDAAMAQRNSSEELAQADYVLVRDRVQYASEVIPEAAAPLRSVLKRCHASSAVKVADMPAMMERLAQSVAANAAVLGRVGVTTEVMAQFSARREDLAGKLSAFRGAASEQRTTSTLRTRARVNLVSQLRLVEGALKRTLTEEGLDGLDTRRKRCLPRYIYDSDSGVAVPDDATEGEAPVDSGSDEARS